MMNKNELNLENGVEIPQSEIRSPQSNALRILLLEDSPTDAELNEHLLRKAGIDFTSLRVETSTAFVAALDTFHPDIILADYNLPEFDGMAALQIVRRDHPEVPVIMVTGALSDIEAVELIHAGAKDYMLKDRPARLAAAVQRALSIEQGIRARKLAEERFRKISESAQDAIMMMGADQCVSFWNAAAERIFGYTAAEAMGRELHALIVPAPAHAKFTQAFPNFQKTGEGPIIGRVRDLIALRKGGEEFPVELSVSAAQVGGLWHAVGIVRDITERKQAEAQINKQLDELRRWYDATLEQGMRNIELKREVNELLKQAGQPARYPSAEQSNAAAEGSLRSSGAAPRSTEGRVSGGVPFTGEPTGVPLAGE